MAVTYQSVQTNTTGSGTTVVVTKPTSLAVGDLMLAQFAFGVDGRTITLPSGFVELDKRENTSNGHTSQISYKIADAGDVAASNFTFTMSGVADYLQASILRITGQAASPFNDYDGQYNSSASTTCSIPSITTSESSLIVIFEGVAGGSVTASGQTITTSPPTFTEIYDFSGGASTSQISCAYGRRLESTDTGAVSVTLSSSVRSVGHVVSIAPLITTSTTTESVTLSEDIDYNIGVTVSESITATENMVNTKSRQWNNPDKSTSVWDNQEK